MEEFRTEERDEVFIITMPSIVDGKHVREIEAAVKTWLLAAPSVHVLDFKGCHTVASTAYRPFVLYNQSLRANAKALYCVNIAEKLLPQFKQDGLTSVFVPVSSIDEAKRKFKRVGEKFTVDVDFVNPFIMGTRTVLETQANTPLKPGKPFLKKPDQMLPMEIAGVISLVSAEFKGSISICFPGTVFLKIYENMVGEKHETITAEIQDAAGELLNIIFGQAKTVLNDQKGYTIEKAIPTVLVGEKLKIHHQGRSPAIVLPFDSPAGAFHLEILVEVG